MQQTENKSGKNTSRKEKIIYSVLSIIAAITLFLAGFFIRPFFYDETTKEILEIIRLTKENYDGEIVVSDGAYGKSFADAFLDDYSDFYTEEEYRYVLEQGLGKNIGIGVSFLRDDEEAVIFSVEGNSPAFKAGMVKGETIISAEKGGETTNLKNKEEVLAFLSSIREGETISLTTTAKDGVTNKTYQVTKEKYEKNYVYYFDSEYKYYFEKTYGEGEWTATRVINDGADGIVGLPSNVGYIYFESFEGDVELQLEQAFNVFEERGKTKLILDLRDNGGGYIETLNAVTPYFINTEIDNPLIASAKYKDGSEINFYGKGKKFFSGIEDIAVIANSYSASATECMLGAMLYYGSIDKSDLVIQQDANGKQTTYGKGVMQSHVYLSTGAVLKLTVAHVYQPDGVTCINGTGISTIPENVAVSAGNALEKAINCLN